MKSITSYRILKFDAT